MYTYHAKTIGSVGMQVRSYAILKVLLDHSYSTCYDNTSLNLVGGGDPGCPLPLYYTLT